MPSIYDYGIKCYPKYPQVVLNKSNVSFIVNSDIKHCSQSLKPINFEGTFETVWDINRKFD